MLRHYTPTKAGILSLMQSCAVALGQYGIRANAILPGTVETDINKEDLSDVAKRKAMIKRTALGRLGGACSALNSRIFGLARRSILLLQPQKTLQVPWYSSQVTWQSM